MCEYWRVIIQRNILSVDDNTFAPLPGLGTLPKELTAVTRVMQKPLLIIKHSGIQYRKMKRNESQISHALNSRVAIRRRNGWAVSYRLNVNLAKFRSQLEASGVSRHTVELRYNETVCLWMTIYIWGGLLNMEPIYIVITLNIDNHIYKIVWFLKCSLNNPFLQ